MTTTLSATFLKMSESDWACAAVTASAKSGIESVLIAQSLSQISGDSDRFAVDAPPPSRVDHLRGLCPHQGRRRRPLLRLRDPGRLGDLQHRQPRRPDLSHPDRFRYS